jgi:hypothetical protein
MTRWRHGLLNISPMICGLVALTVLVVLPVRAGTTEIPGTSRTGAPNPAVESPAVGALLSSADQANNCTRDGLLRAIQSDMNVSEVAKRLLKPLATSRDQACEALHITSKGEVKTIESLRAHAAACGLRPKDLDPIIADHKDTIRVLSRVCSSAQIPQGATGANRFDDFGMPPFPK